MSFLFITAMDPPPRDKLGGDPIEIAGLFEGDIAGVSSADMAIGKSSKLGKSGTKVSIALRCPFLYAQK